MVVGERTRSWNRSIWDMRGQQNPVRRVTQLACKDLACDHVRGITRSCRLTACGKLIEKKGNTKYKIQK